MICVSLGRRRHSALKQAHRDLGKLNPDLVELRVDWIMSRLNVARLLKKRPTPVVVTCRREQDKGRWSGTEEQRLAVLREAIIGGAEYVDIEEDVAKSIPRYGDTKRLISYHNFQDTPAELSEIYQRMTECDPDVIKIVTMANRPADNVRVLELLKSATVPTVAFCMGEFGIVSRILCGRMGAPFTYAGYSRAGEMAPGQLLWDDMRDFYRYDRITPDTKVFGVIGDPIAHSLSPLLHNSAFKEVDFDGVYLPLRIPPDTVQETLQEYDKLDISGYSVTIPHKHAALDFAELPDAQAELIGASNTLFKADGKWHATNTDYDAIVETVEAGLTTFPADARGIAGKQVLILGAGGVARAAICAMQQNGAAVTITNRSPDRAKVLGEELGCTVVDWEQRGDHVCDILINCTSVGMHPNVSESPFDLPWLNESMLVFDTVYTPENTQLLEHAKTRGCATASGLEMFVRQAARQFELFAGERPPMDFMMETLRHSLSSATE
ncbi:MAG: shikimate dehydrogenase [Fuerstiella sp.]|nr:shikimate dehydrogenase [Fuerstiella sp.]MCP4858823.1 shikimate dehydrogenase [Fuerstiella sp.]